MSAPQRLHRLVRNVGLGVLVAAGLAACAEYPASSEDYGYSSGIGVEMGTYPRMVLVPGMPVYYDPYSPFNYFFYDGLYWVYRYDAWYASSWYNGPWNMVGPAYVPYYLWAVPVRYYRAPPPYFHGWRPDDPPHWHEHYGHDWDRYHGDWDDMKRRPPPPPAPLPNYQRDYSGSRYPHDRELQEQIRQQHYRYQPRDFRPQQGQAPYMQSGDRQPQTPPPPMPPPPKKKDGQPQYQYQQYPPPPSSYPPSQPQGQSPYQGQPSDRSQPDRDGDHHHRAPPPPPASDDQSTPPSWQQSQRDSAPPPRYQPVPQYQPPQQPSYQQPSSPSTHSSMPPESSSGKGHSKRSAPPGKDDDSGTQQNH